MHSLADLGITVISLVFLGILGFISGVAVPGLFMAAAAPWLDWILPARKKRRLAPDGGEVLRGGRPAPRGPALSAG